MTYIPKIKNGRLDADAVTSDKILDGEVMTDDLALDAVTGDQLADDAVGSEHIATGAVGNDELGADAVDGSKIADDAIGAEHIAAGAVGEDELASAAVTEGKIGSGAVTEDKLGSGAVTEDKLGTGSVTENKLGSSAVTEGKIAAGAVTNAKVAADAAIELSKLATDPLARENHTGTQLAATISDFDAQVQSNSLDEMAAPEADVDMAGNKLTGLAEPTADSDAATKGYVDGVAMGLDVKASVRTASTEELDLSAPGVEIGPDIGMNVGDRVLVKDQTDQAENGIYVWNGFDVPMTRSEDADEDAEVTAGMFTFVEEGFHADQGWVQISDGQLEVGASALEFVQFSNAIIVSTLDSLTDVAVDGAVDGSVLRFNGSEWVDSENVKIDDANAKVDLAGGTHISQTDGNVTVESETGDAKLLAFNTARVYANDLARLRSFNNHVWIDSGMQIELNASTGLVVNSGVLFRTDEIAGGSLFKAEENATEFLILAAAGSDFDLPLPENGRMLIIKNHDGGAEAAPITLNGSIDDNFTIDGEYTYTMDVNYQSVTLMSDGNNWYVV
jgi:hypothetical protein